ncbi:MAG: transcription elongation factor GreB [Steroidobacteraceae bacterium]|nr:transcription elongation factor GreB [Steroidobacteraceae bacterium]
MNRPRTGSKPGSRYATPEGAARLRAELDQLWLRERPAVTRAVAEAAAMGDRSENAEYIYGKRRLREIDRRVRFLRQRLDGLKVVSAPPADRSRAFFGAWVSIEDAQGRVRRHRIVGPDEFDREPGFISMDSPLGRALLGRRVDDEFEVELPAGRRRFTVTAIDYEK